MNNPIHRPFAFFLALIFFLLVPLCSHAADWWTVCTPERDRLCKGIEAGGGRIIKCLDENASELSDACMAAKSAPPSREADRADIKAWTPNGSQCTWLCTEYTNDGGHLAPEGQLRAARGIYSLFLQLAGG